MRSRPWVSLLLLVLVIAALWLLDGRQPQPWPEAEWPWSIQVDALSLATRAIDRVNAVSAISPDLPAASLALLVGVALVALATLGTLDVPVAIALAVAASAVFLRSTWSTAAPGLDARAVLVVGLAVLSVARPDRRWLPGLVVVVTLALAPSAAWLVVPAILLAEAPWRHRLVAAVVLTGAATALRTWQLHQAWDTVSCLPAGQAWRVLGDVLRPGELVDVSAWWALQRTLGLWRDDLHAFGLALAAVGLFGPSVPPRLRRATVVALAIGLGCTMSGLVPPARVAALLVPWTLPWLALGLSGLAQRASRHRAPATACLALAVVAIPVLRHAVVAPAPWRSASPAIARALATRPHGGLVAADDEAMTRRARLSGDETIPASPDTLARCVASGREVLARGSLIERVQGLGFLADDAPLHAPLAALLADTRDGAWVVFGISPGTLPYAGAQGLRALERVGLPRAAIGARDAVGLIARVGAGAESRHGNGGVDLSLVEGTLVGGQALLAPWSATATGGEAAADSPPTRLASSRHAALVVLDRAQDVALRTTAAPRAGLPIALGTHAMWRQARVTGTPVCVPAGATWTTLTAHPRVSVPLAGASAATPALLYVASRDLPEPGVRGLPLEPLRPAWSSATFDRQVPADAARLLEAVRADAVPQGTLGQERYMTRIALHPSTRQLQGHAAISAGTAPARWWVRLASASTRPEHAEVCAMPDGARVLDGPSGLVDDDTAFEVPVATRDGWHTAERNRGVTFQWTARPVATATFRARATRDLVLALDAIGADVGGGAQPITLRVNGQMLRDDWRGAGRITVPAALLAPELDVLSIEVPQVARPATDGRPLGVLIRQLRLIGPTS
ncbi:hypothetical protein TBR22_A26470 [Luteitalea sp. TBR-22]|nr:hypothetical protein TBR22_A26470 [Luteitalea sp. TBR-22]